MHPMVYGGLLRLAIASQGVAVNASGRNVVSFLLRQKGNSTNSPHVFSVIGSASVPMVQLYMSLKLLKGSSLSMLPLWINFWQSSRPMGSE